MLRGGKDAVRMLRAFLPPSLAPLPAARPPPAAGEQPGRPAGGALSSWPGQLGLGTSGASSMCLVSFHRSLHRYVDILPSARFSRKVGLQVGRQGLLAQLGFIQTSASFFKPLSSTWLEPSVLGAVCGVRSQIHRACLARGRRGGARMCFLLPSFLCSDLSSLVKGWPHVSSRVRH